MATINNGQRQSRWVLSAALFLLGAAAVHQSAAAADDATPSPDEVICRNVIDEAADQIHQYCDARHLNTLQCLDFLGSHGSQSNDTLERRWITSLKERGMTIRDADSTLLQGRLVSQTSGEASILLLQCTLTDNSGAELRTFRVRKVIGD